MLTLNLAGWTIRLSCRPAGLEHAVATRYVAFLVADADEPACTIQVEARGMAPECAASPGHLLAAPLTRQGDIFVLDALQIHGTIEPSSRQASLMLGDVALLDSVEYFLRTVCALVAYRDGGLLVHGAGLAIDGQVLLFIGQSGSGKSTTVAMSPGALALGDDLILLRPDGAAWVAHGTPFWNRDALERGGQTACGPLAGIYRLVQDRQVYLEEATTAAAAAELVANCPVVNGIVEWMPDLLGRCMQLAQVVPVRRLHFRKDDTFWALLRSGDRTTTRPVLAAASAD